MSDFPGGVPTPLTQTTFSFNAGPSTFSLWTPASRTWVANLAIYCPVMVPWSYTVQRVFWINGSTASSNADFGIYTSDGTKLYSTGSTAQSGASVPQFVTPTTFVLSPGTYYFAWACDGTTNRAFGSSVSATTLRLSGVLEQATAFPLPATMTGATVTNALYPLCGVTRTTTGF